MKTFETAEYCRYEFTRSELAEHAKELARANESLFELDLRQKRLAADIQAEKKGAAENIQKLASWISHGFDYRMVTCVTEFNDPMDGKKTTYRKDTREWLKTLDMDAAEIAAQKQAPLPFDGVPCSTCMPRFLNSGHRLVDGPDNDCKVCGGSGKQPEEAAAATTNGAPAANGTAPAEPATEEPGTVVDAEALEVEAASGPAIASQAQMSRAAKGKRA